MPDLSLREQLAVIENRDRISGAAAPYLVDLLPKRESPAGTDSERASASSARTDPRKRRMLADVFGADLAKNLLGDTTDAEDRKALESLGVSFKAMDAAIDLPALAYSFYGQLHAMTQGGLPVETLRSAALDLLDRIAERIRSMSDEELSAAKERRQADPFAGPYVHDLKRWKQ